MPPETNRIKLVHYGGNCYGVKPYREGSGVPRCMAQAFEMKNKLAAKTPLNADEHQSWTARYFGAQTACFGSGPSRGYADAWNETFGLMAGSRGELILRLDSPEDRACFCKDALQGAERLRAPEAYNSKLELAPVHTAFSGSLPSSAWDAPLAAFLGRAGRPSDGAAEPLQGLPGAARRRVLPIHRTLFGATPDDTKGPRRGQSRV